MLISSTGVKIGIVIHLFFFLQLDKWILFFAACVLFFFLGLTPQIAILQLRRDRATATWVFQHYGGLMCLM